MHIIYGPWVKCGRGLMGYRKRGPSAPSLSWICAWNHYKTIDNCLNYCVIIFTHWCVLIMHFHSKPPAAMLVFTQTTFNNANSFCIPLYSGVTTWPRGGCLYLLGTKRQPSIPVTIINGSVVMPGNYDIPVWTPLWCRRSKNRYLN